MRLGALVVGEWYAISSRAGGAAMRIGRLLSTDHHVNVWPGNVIERFDPDHHRGRYGQPGQRPRVRDVPVVTLRPIVYLADGTPLVTEWSWTLHVGQDGYRNTYQVDPGAMHVEAAVDLVSVSAIRHVVPDCARFARAEF